MTTLADVLGEYDSHSLVEVEEVVARLAPVITYDPETDTLTWDQGGNPTSTRAGARTGKQIASSGSWDDRYLMPGPGFDDAGPMVSVFSLTERIADLLGADNQWGRQMSGRGSRYRAALAAIGATAAGQAEVSG